MRIPAWSCRGGQRTISAISGDDPPRQHGAGVRVRANAWRVSNLLSTKHRSHPEFEAASWLPSFRRNLDFEGMMLAEAYEKWATSGSILKSSLILNCGGRNGHDGGRTCGENEGN